MRDPSLDAWLEEQSESDESYVGNDDENDDGDDDDDDDDDDDGEVDGAGDDADNDAEEEADGKEGGMWLHIRTAPWPSTVLHLVPCTCVVHRACSTRWARRTHQCACDAQARECACDAFAPALWPVLAVR